MYIRIIEVAKMTFLKMSSVVGNETIFWNRFIDIQDKRKCKYKKRRPISKSKVRL